MLKSICRTCGAHVYSMQETGWKAFHTVQESDGHLKQASALHSQNQQKAQDSRAGDSLEDRKKMQLRLTLGVPLQWHMDERLNKTHSSIRAVVCFHTPHPAAAPCLCSRERETRPGSFTSTGSLPGCRLHQRRVPHPPTTPPLWGWAFAPGSPPSAVRQRCCKWRDKGPGGWGGGGL